MARYTYNCDKYCCGDDNGLYNTVVGLPVFSDEGAEPLTVEQVKSWGKVEQDTDDSIIEDLITSARQACEEISGLGFITRTIVVTINNANGGFVLPWGPVTGDVVVTDNEDATWSDLRGEYEVTYTGGYATLPKGLQTAIKQQFLFEYENRGESNIGVSPMAMDKLLRVRMVA